MDALTKTFNPEHRMFNISKDDKDITKKFKNRASFESQIFDEVYTNLIKDLECCGVNANYSIRILIHEIALNLVLISRIKTHLVSRPPSVEAQELKVHCVQNDRGTGKKLVEFLPYDGKEYVPQAYFFLIRLQKETTKLIEKLGLLPQQQVERQKLVIIERMKKKLVELENNGESYRVDAIGEIKRSV